jgi:hypothetical protein
MLLCHSLTAVLLFAFSGDHGGSVYYHPMFQRAHPENCMNIKRKTNRKKKSSQLGDIEVGVVE